MKKDIIRGYYCDTLPFDYDEESNSIWYFGKWVSVNNVPLDEGSNLIIYDTKWPPPRN